MDPGQYRQVTEWADANSLINGGLRLTRQPPSLRSLIYGLSDLSLIAQIKGGNHVLFVRRPLVYNRVLELFSSFDLLFIAGTLLSLVAMVLTHDAIAGERDSGLLRLVLSHSVSGGDLLLGKWLGNQAVLAAITMPGLGRRGAGPVCGCILHGRLPGPDTDGALILGRPGKASGITYIEVIWPDGDRQRLASLEPSRANRIVAEAVFDGSGTATRQPPMREGDTSS